MTAPIDRDLLRQTWSSKPLIFVLLAPVCSGLAWGVMDAPWFPRYLVWLICLLLAGVALGALISTRVTVDGRRVLTLQKLALGVPFSWQQFDPANHPLRQIELRVTCASGRNSGQAEITGSDIKSLRLSLSLRSDTGSALVAADSLALPVNTPQPDSASEVISWLRKKNQREFLSRGMQLAEALQLPLICSGDWGRDQGKELVRANAEIPDSLQAVPRAGAPLATSPPG